MYFLEVIPLIYLPKEKPQVLSYFSQKKFKPKSLVLAPIKNQKIPAIVLENEPLEKKKLLIKESNFLLKEISEALIEEEFFPDYFFDFLEKASKYYFSSLTLSWFSAFPKNLKNFSKFWKKTSFKKSYSWKLKDFDFSLSPTLKKIFSQILKEIQEEIKEKKQVLIIFPDNVILNLFALYLSSNFKGNFCFFSFSLPSKKLAEIYKAIFFNKIQIVLGLSSSLFAPFSSLAKIIIFDPKNNSHKNSNSRPFFDNRTLAKILSSILKIPLLEIDPFKEFEKKKTKIEILSLKENPEEILTKKALSEIESKKNILLIVNRKGYAPYLLCQDCFRVLSCENCDSPLVFYKKLNLKTLKIEPKLICRHCGKEKKPIDFCPFCKGYLLKLSGLGIQKVKEKFPFFEEFSKDKQKTFKKELKFIKNFLSQKEKKLISTAIISKWFWLFEDLFDLAIILRAESFLAFPDYLSFEKFYLFSLRLKFISKKLLIQTFNPENYLFKSLKEENLEKFLEKEINLRKKFGFPPKGKLIRIVYSDKSSLKAKKEAQKVAWQLKFKKIKFLGPTPSFIFKKKNRFFYEILIKLENEKEKNLALKVIPSDWIIDVDPVKFS